MASLQVDAIRFNSKKGLLLQRRIASTLREWMPSFGCNGCYPVFSIAIDIRYALFLIDKFAGAGYLLEEMEIVE